MALFRGIQEYIALDANNITLVFDSGNIVNISGNIFLYPPQGHPILYNYCLNIKLSDSRGELPNHPNRVNNYQPDPNLKIFNGQLVFVVLLKLRDVQIYLLMFLKRKQVI